jgi:hypothetical protein
MASWTCSASIYHPLNINCTPYSAQKKKKIFWAAPSLHLSRRISEITLPYVRPRPTPPLIIEIFCIPGRPHSVQCSRVPVRNAREPRSGRGAGGREPGHSMFGPLDPVSTASFPSTDVTLLCCLQLPPLTLPAAYLLHVVHCSMHRRIMTPSFGSASSALTMSCCATTTRSSFGPLFR